MAIKTIINIIKHSNKIVSAGKALINVGSRLKGWIFSDGKFNAVRAVILIAGGLVTGVGYYYVPDYMPVIYDHLDELSDMIGYAKQ